MNTAILLFVALCVIIVICDFVGWVREQIAARNLPETDPEDGQNVDKFQI